MEIYKAKFGAMLKGLLETKGIKQYQLAEKIGVEAPNVSRWVKGVNFPEESHFKKLCGVLKVDEDYFIDFSSNEKSDLIVSIVSKLPALHEHQLRSILKFVTTHAEGVALDDADSARDFGNKQKRLHK